MSHTQLENIFKVLVVLVPLMAGVLHAIANRFAPQVAYMSYKSESSAALWHLRELPRLTLLFSTSSPFQAQRSRSSRRSTGTGPAPETTGPPRPAPSWPTRARTAATAACPVRSWDRPNSQPNTQREGLLHDADSQVPVCLGLCLSVLA